MHRFLHCEKKSMAAFLVFFLFAACTRYHTVRVTVPVEEAATVGKLTQPAKRPAAERKLLGASGKFVRVGEITQVRLIGKKENQPDTIPLPFWADEQKGHLVIQDKSGKLQSFPLGEIQKMEVDTLLPGGSWKVWHYLLLPCFAALVGISFIAGFIRMTDRHYPDFD